MGDWRNVSCTYLKNIMFCNNKSFRFFRYLRNVSIPPEEANTNRPNIEFTADGDLKSAELKIMNLRPGANSKNLVWEEVKYCV